MKIAIINLSKFEVLQTLLLSIDDIYANIIDPKIDLYIEDEEFKYFENIDTKVNIIPLKMKQIGLFDIKVKYDNIRYYAKKNYDIAIDTQGDIKTSLITYLIAGRTAGYKYDKLDRKIVSSFYDEKVDVDGLGTQEEKFKKLFSKIFGYSL